MTAATAPTRKGRPSTNLSMPPPASSSFLRLLSPLFFLRASVFPPACTSEENSQPEACSLINCCICANQASSHGNHEALPSPQQLAGAAASSKKYFCFLAVDISIPPRNRMANTVADNSVPKHVSSEQAFARNFWIVPYQVPSTTWIRD